MSEDKKYTIDELYNATDEQLAGFFRDGIKQYFIAMNDDHEGSHMGFSNVTDAKVTIEITPARPYEKWVKRSIGEEKDK